MNVREEVESMKKEVEDLEQQSLAMEMLKEQKKANKRWFVAWIITFLVCIGLIGYIFFLLNDIGVEKDIVKQENDKGYNNYIGRDGSVANGETNNYYH